MLHKLHVLGMNDDLWKVEVNLIIFFETFRANCER